MSPQEDAGPLSMADRGKLGELLVETAYLQGDFVLSSGARSKYYFDKYLFETQPKLLRLVAAEMASRIPADCERLAGPELGAVPLATAVSLASGLPFVIVRKGSKGYGTSRLIEGAFQPGERVLLIEDVISTAGEALRSAAVLRDAGVVVSRVLAVIDREQDGRANLEAVGLELDALFMLGELPVPGSSAASR
jgi:orotate phosphoribosyltransferase